MDQIEVPDVPTTVVGWKFLRWTGTRFYSMTGGFIWPYDAPAHAVCAYGNRPPCGTDACGCGIYAYSDVGGLKEYLSSAWHGDRETLIAVRLEMGGRFISYKKGWRAEYAMVTGIYPMGRQNYVERFDGQITSYATDIDHAELREAASAYGVPLLEKPSPVPQPAVGNHYLGDIKGLPAPDGCETAPATAGKKRIWPWMILRVLMCVAPTWYGMLVINTVFDTAWGPVLCVPPWVFGLAASAAGKRMSNADA